MLNVTVNLWERREQGGHVRAAGTWMALKIAAKRAVNWLTKWKKEKYIIWVKDQTKPNKLDDQSSEQTDYTGNSTSKYFT